jgi:hypothetical protein
VLAGDEAVGFELARKYMDDFLAETLVCSNALAFLEASRCAGTRIPSVKYCNISIYGRLVGRHARFPLLL